jgi:uncharacterized protein YodC (DUF2158 family)
MLGGQADGTVSGRWFDERNVREKGRFDEGAVTGRFRGG